MHMCTPPVPINPKPCMYQSQSALKHAIEERGAVAMAETPEAEHEYIFEDLLGTNSEQCRSSSANPSSLVPEPVAKVMKSIYHLSTIFTFFFCLEYNAYNDKQVTNFPSSPHSWEEKEW